MKLKLGKIGELIKPKPKNGDNQRKKGSSNKTIIRNRTAQNSIHYKAMLEDGVCVMDDDLYSMAILFTDINYQIASEEKQNEIITQYGMMLQSVGNGIDVSLCINNRLINMEEFQKQISMDWRGDGLDNIRSEMNQHLLNNIEFGNNAIISDKLFTFTCREKNVRDARRTLYGLANDFKNRLEELGCKTKILDGSERLKIMYSITHPGCEFHFDYGDLSPKQTSKDYIAPYNIEFERRNFYMDGRYGCVLVLQNYPTWLQDKIVIELSKLETNLVFSFHMAVLTKDESLQLINKTRQKVDMQIDSENQKNIDRANFSGSLPHNLKAQDESVDIWRVLLIN